MLHINGYRASMRAATSPSQQMCRRRDLGDHARPRLASVRGLVLLDGRLRDTSPLRHLVAVRLRPSTNLAEIPRRCGTTAAATPVRAPVRSCAGFPTSDLDVGLQKTIKSGPVLLR